MKVIFLDADGVLNSDKFFDDAKIKGIESEFDVDAIKLLKEAVEKTGARVVLDTSFRYKKKAELLVELLIQNGVYIIGKTPFLNNERGNEIKQWLSEHNDVENYVILDDEIFESYDEELLEHLIKISNGNGMNFGEGLQKKDVIEIVQRLGERQIESDKKDDLDR